MKKFVAGISFSEGFDKTPISFKGVAFKHRMRTIWSLISGH